MIYCREICQKTGEDFGKWFELNLAATGGTSIPARVQSSLFLHVAGEEAVEVYNTFTFEEDDDKHKLVKISLKNIATQKRI